MFADLARVFSSQGVVMETTRLVPMPKPSGSPTSVRGMTDLPDSSAGGFHPAAFELDPSLELALKKSQAVSPRNRVEALSETEKVSVKPARGREQAPSPQTAAIGVSSQGEALRLRLGPEFVQAQAQGQGQGQGGRADAAKVGTEANQGNREQKLLHPCGSGPCNCRAQLAL